jgi:hypothetical protein
MHRTIIACFVIALLATSSALAISPSDDLLIAAAARTNRWTADMYIVNPGNTSVTVDVMWLERDQANPNPQTESFNMLAGETLVLDDVILNNFGKTNAGGAFHITATGGPVTANLVVFTGAGSQDGTYGSGFEAIPASSATSAGESTTLSGVVLDDDFYTNLFALAGANGATMDLALLDTDGTVLDTVQMELEAYEPWLSGVATLWDVESFANGTARAAVTAGSMVMLGSKIDRISKDPTTLEQAFSAGGGSVDGIYQFAIWDDIFAAGGELVVENGMVIEIIGNYSNYQKLDAQNDPACPVLWNWGWDFPLTGVAVGDFASGFEYTEDFSYYADGGEFTWTLTLTFDDNVGFSGTIDAVGADFTGADTGCNGVFPPLPMFGGKSN